MVTMPLFQHKSDIKFITAINSLIFGISVSNGEFELAVRGFGD